MHIHNIQCIRHTLGLQNLYMVSNSSLHKYVNIVLDIIVSYAIHSSKVSELFNVDDIHTDFVDRSNLLRYIHNNIKIVLIRRALASRDGADLIFNCLPLNPRDYLLQL